MNLPAKTRHKTLVTLDRKQVEQLDELRWHLRADRSELIRRAVDLFLAENSHTSDTPDLTENGKAA